MPTLNIMVVFFTVLALTMGLPTPDAEYDAFDMASHEVTVLLQQGKDDSACADLAKSLIDEVTDKVDSANKLIATLDDGSDCSSKGQDAVATATTNKENAEKAATEAASAASSATDTEVDFGSYSLNSLAEGTCAQFWSDPSYTAAKQAVVKAATAQTEADAKAKAAEAPLQAAQEQAAMDVKACQCAARANYNKAYSAATEGVEADAAAYTKGKNMQCVLAGTAAADCKVGDVPKLKEITLAEGVPAEVCPTPSPTASPTTSPTTSPTSSPTQPKFAVNQMNVQQGPTNVMCKPGTMRPTTQNECKEALNFYHAKDPAIKTFNYLTIPGGGGQQLEVGGWPQGCEYLPLGCFATTSQNDGKASALIFNYNGNCNDGWLTRGTIPTPGGPTKTIPQGQSLFDYRRGRSSGAPDSYLQVAGESAIKYPNYYWQVCMACTCGQYGCGC